MFLCQLCGRYGLPDPEGEGDCLFCGPVPWVLSEAEGDGDRPDMETDDAFHGDLESPHDDSIPF